MIKKMFALASVTALVGLVATAGAAGCSSSSGDPGSESPDGGGAEGGIKEGGSADTSPDPEPDASGPAEEATVGKACDTTADCKVADTKNDNVCSKGGFATGDLFGSPVCIQPTCKQGTGKTVGDLLCDGNAGLCSRPRAERRACAFRTATSTRRP